MTPQFLLVGAGLLLVLAALFGGGLEIKDIKVPQLSGPLRLVAGIVGAVLVALGLSSFVLRQEGPTSPTSVAQWRTWNFAAGAHPSFDCLDYAKLTKQQADPWSDVICMNTALADADRAMGDNFKAFKNSRPPDQVHAVLEDQRHWAFVTRNQPCHATWSDLESETLVENIADCLLEQTQKRTKFFMDSMQSQ